MSMNKDALLKMTEYLNEHPETLQAMKETLRISMPIQIQNEALRMAVRGALDEEIKACSDARAREVISTLALFE